MEHFNAIVFHIPDSVHGRLWINTVERSTPSATLDERDQKKTPQKKTTRCQRQEKLQTDSDSKANSCCTFALVTQCVSSIKVRLECALSEPESAREWADETWIYKGKGKCNSEHAQMPGALPLRSRSPVQIRTEFQMPSTKGPDCGMTRLCGWQNHCHV